MIPLGQISFSLLLFSLSYTISPLFSSTCWPLLSYRKWTSSTQLEKLANKQLQAYVGPKSAKSVEWENFPLLFKYQSWGRTLIHQACVMWSSKGEADRTIVFVNPSKITGIRKGKLLKEKVECWHHNMVESLKQSVISNHLLLIKWSLLLF